ncbi:uncharacterized protein LOC122429059 isoform X4 [Cervus canadensis]|uniref:uncharacterized protein LOC122429059 isoform X4 n=1 Tax=Cervus canadensis TaxID=1574408 RepID=UPI001CA36F15|nr:uncharacterized protein LOC122429059 isoform X4 [Cervus canadensis]
MSLLPGDHRSLDTQRGQWVKFQAIKKKYGCFSNVPTGAIPTSLESKLNEHWPFPIFGSLLEPSIYGRTSSITNTQWIFLKLLRLWKADCVGGTLQGIGNIGEVNPGSTTSSSTRSCGIRVRLPRGIQERQRAQACQTFL